MEICVGEYVRTKKGHIGKVVYIRTPLEGLKNDRTAYFIDWDNRKSYYISQIKDIKHSKNIIDLIEVGDYVNGSKVLEIMEDMNTGEIHLEMTSNYTNQEIGDCTIYDKDIKTIVTKESFKEREYVF